MKALLNIMILKDLIKFKKIKIKVNLYVIMKLIKNIEKLNNSKVDVVWLESKLPKPETFSKNQTQMEMVNSAGMSISKVSRIWMMDKYHKSIHNQTDNVLIDFQQIAKILIYQYSQNTLHLLNILHSFPNLVNMVSLRVWDQYLHLQLINFNLEDAINNNHVEDIVHFKVKDVNNLKIKYVLKYIRQNGIDEIDLVSDDDKYNIKIL